MEYLSAAISLLSLVRRTNSELLENMERLVSEPNQMRLKNANEPTRKITMSSYSNEFVKATLQDNGTAEYFVITDVVSTKMKGEELYYILYKGYHAKIETGNVFFQVIDKESLKPKGPLQFSNMEENIFYQVNAPKAEESSCNAMETDKVIENGKSILFLIGYTNEQRLVYDIQRLIFDTVNNVWKHRKLSFEFIVQIAHYGGTPSNQLKEEVKAIDTYTQKCIYPEYPNAKFTFEFEEHTG